MLPFNLIAFNDQKLRTLPCVSLNWCDIPVLQTCVAKLWIQMQFCMSFCSKNTLITEKISCSNPCLLTKDLKHRHKSVIFSNLASWLVCVWVASRLETRCEPPIRNESALKLKMITECRIHHYLSRLGWDHFRPEFSVRLIISCCFIPEVYCA